MLARSWAFWELENYLILSILCCLCGPKLNYWCQDYSVYRLAPIGEQFTVTLMNPKATNMGLLKLSLLHPPHTFIQGWVRKMDNQFSKFEQFWHNSLNKKKFQFCRQKQSNIRTPTPEQILFWWENYSLHKGDRIDLWNILPQKSFFFYCLMYLYLSQSCIHPPPPQKIHIFVNIQKQTLVSVTIIQPG